MIRSLTAVMILAATSLNWSSTIQAEEASKEPIAFGDIISIGTTDMNPADQFLQPTADGDVLLSWTEDGEGKRARNAFLATVDSQGKLGESRQINDEPGSVHWYGGDNRLKYTVAPDGGITVVYASPLDAFKTGVVKTTRATKDGDFKPSKWLNDDDNDPPVAHAFATVAASPNGKIYATWIDGRNRTFLGMAEPEAPSERRKDIKMRDLTIPESVMQMGPQTRRNFVEENSQLFMAISEDGGETFDTNYPITEINVCACCMPTISFLDSGDTVIVSYREVGEGYLRDNVVIRSTDGGKTFSEPAFISEDGWIAKFCPHAGSSVIADRNDRIHSLWFTAGKQRVDDAGIYYTYSDDAGESFAPRQLLDSTPAHTVLHAQVVEDASGRLWGVWENFLEGDQRKPQIFMAHRAPDATEWSERYLVSEGGITSMLPSLATDGTNIYVAWTEKNGETSTVKLRTASLVGS